MLRDAARHSVAIPRTEDVLVYVVDDDDAVRSVFEKLLARSGYRVRGFASAIDALAAMGSDSPAVVVTDQHMPVMTGIEFSDRAAGLDPDIRFIFVTGAGGESTAQAALRLGAVDYLTKPVDAPDLARAVHKAAMQHALNAFGRAKDQMLREEVRRKTEELREVTLGTLASLVNALEARSPHFQGHSQNVASCAESIASALGLSTEETAVIRTAGLLHDVGMIGVPDAIINRPGQLTPDERAVIEDHCRKGAEILEPLLHLGPAIRSVLEHHERIDGSGYPEKKRGDAISLGGQIVGLAETWTAITEVRSFRDSMTTPEAIATLAGAAGRWYAVDLVDALLSVVSKQR